MRRAKKVAVTGGAGQIAYSLLFRIANGEMFGPDQPIELYILDIPELRQVLEGVAMELEDCAFPMLREIRITTDPGEAFDEVDYALLVGAKPRGAGMERSDLLFDNGKIFMEMGRAIGENGAKDVLVFVVGNPCNTNALIVLHHAKRLRPDQVFSMSRLDQNRAAYMLAKRAHVPVAEVKQVAIWGNHSSTQVPDFFHALIRGTLAEEVIQDRPWLEEEFVPTIQKRGAAVIAARGKSSAASAANAIVDSIHSLIQPTPSGDWFSVGLYTQGNSYGIDPHLFFSFPCRRNEKGKVEIVQGLKWDPFLKGLIEKTHRELLEEKSAIAKLLS